MQCIGFVGVDFVRIKGLGTKDSSVLLHFQICARAVDGSSPDRVQSVISTTSGQAWLTA